MMTDTTGYSAYHNSQNLTDDSRDLEYRLLAQVTSALIEANENSDSAKMRVEAAMWNRDVWSALRVDLSSEENQLPSELKASLVSLSLWIERETQLVMDGKGDMGALIEVNKNIMAGLKPNESQDGAQETASSNNEGGSPLPDGI